MTQSKDLSLLSVPAFWPMAMAATMLEEGTELYAKNLKFVEEEIKIHGELRPALATPNKVRLDLRTMVLRDYGKPGGIPTLVDAPHAGHTAVIADYYDGQSLVQTLLANGIDHVALTDWKSATPDMKDLEVDDYLAEIIVAIDDLGGRVNLVGLCQGGWMSAMIAARFPDKVNSLVLAGAPIDTDAGNGSIKSMVHQSPASFYQELVALGGGLMKGKFMLQGWKNMHPDLIIVVARTGGAGSKGISLIVLETEGNPGFKRGRNLDKIGLQASDTSELFFEDAVAPFENLLGEEEGLGFKQLMQQLPQERLIIAVGAVAAMERAVRITAEYTKERKAFGQPIIDFQNTAFKLAERKTEATIARVFLDWCIERLIAGDLDAGTASMAKWWCTQKQVETVDECLQLHGGYGYMQEYPISRMFVDARIQKIYGGTNEIMKLLIARSL